MKKPYSTVLVLTLPCNGFNPRTGKRVGSRHRWEGSMCKWCGRFKDQIKTEVKARL